jgi:hypothetical protein
MEDLAPAPAKVPVYKKWWLWTIVGVAVVGGATAAGVVLGTKSSKAASVTGRAQW